MNEYVIWEIIEPLIQNCVDHNDAQNLELTIRTHLEGDAGLSIHISDNGTGFSGELLEEDDSGIKRLFQESVSTKVGDEHSGYGCYIAYEMGRRAGWELDAHNKQEGGACFLIQAKLS